MARGHSGGLLLFKYLATAALALLASCASPPPPQNVYLSKDYVPPAPNAMVLLLHVPADEAVYQAGDRLAQHIATSMLTAAGYRVGIVSADDYAVLLAAERQRLAQGAVQPSIQDWAKADFKALSTLASVAGRQTGSPMLVRTRLLTRSTIVRQRTAAWDGQTRQLLYVGMNRDYASVRGTGSGVSLEVVAVDVSGKLLARSFGGVTLPYLYQAEDGTAVERTDLFADDRELKEGAAIALTPLLPK